VLDSRENVPDVDSSSSVKAASSALVGVVVGQVVVRLCEQVMSKIS
jgi:hypothetical protein